MKELFHNQQQSLNTGAVRACGVSFSCICVSSNKDNSPRLAVKTWFHLQQQSLNTPKNNAYTSQCICVYCVCAPVCALA